MIVKKNSSVVSHYIFWITFVFFTNPGGIQEALGEKSGDGGINMTDLLFVILTGCYLFTFYIYKHENDQVYNKLKKYLFIFLVYFLIVFGFITATFNESPGYTPLFFLIKNRNTIINIILFVFIYKFYINSYLIFYKVFIYSSLIIIPLFITSVLFSIDILPVLEYRRNFTILERKFMVDYGLMPHLISMGISVLVFKFNIKYKKHIIISFILLFLTYVLSITRRFIFGTFVVFFIASILDSFISKRQFFSIKKILKIFLFTSIIFYGIYLSFPRYVDAGVLAFNETVNVFVTGKTSSGKRDERLGFSRVFIVNLIKQHPLFGTGFDNRWRTGEGDKEGYEAADYPLLSSIAMTGFFGLLIFLPIYIILLRILAYDIKFLRQKGFSENSFEQYVLLAFILYFIYDLLQYMNWFLAIAKSSDTIWYYMLALYVASRKVYYNNYTLTR